MIILGLDPGLARTGFGIIDTSQTHVFVRCGCLTTPPHLPTADRLLMVGRDLEVLLRSARPELAVVENVFFGRNTTTAMLTAQVRGMLLYVLRQHHIAVETVTPLQIKSRLTGYGAADKHQVRAVVQRLLHLDAPPNPDDAADALAAALSTPTVHVLP